MRIEVGLNHILDKTSQIDVEGMFPELIDQNVCYTEMGKQLLLEKIKDIHHNLERQSHHFLEIMGVLNMNEKHATFKKTLEQLAKDLTKDPFRDMNPSISPEFQELIDNAQKLSQPVYVSLIKVLTELSWRHEVFGDNILFLKNKLAETCSQIYLDLKSDDIMAKLGGNVKAISHLVRDKSTRDAVMFGRSTTPSRITLDVGEYGDQGSINLMESLNLYFNTYLIAAAYKDSIQAFRSFRKAVRVRKRFGLSETLHGYIINKDILMTQQSLNQMGGSKDDLELRKFEVHKRAEQQIRNLKYKTIVVEKNKPQGGQ